MANIVPDTQPHFAPTLAAGGFVFVSGQLGFTARGVIEGDLVQQTRQCLDNLEALLAPHGLTRQDVVKTTVWLRNEADFPAYNQAYGDFFGAHRPTRSTLICALARPEAVVEIEAIALVRPAGDACQAEARTGTAAARTVGGVAVMALALAFALNAGAPAKADPVADRKAILKAFGAATPGPMLQGKEPFDLAKVQAALETYQRGARTLPRLFPSTPSTTPSDALPEVWKSKADFESRFAKLAVDARAARGAIRDEASFRAEFPKVLANCRGCHDTYRAKK